MLIKLKNGGANLRNSKFINLRAFAIILVVLAHSIIIYNPYWGVINTEYKSSFLKYICLIIYIFHMPLFFAISGYFYNKTLEHNYSYKQFILIKLKRLIIPYIFIGFFWLLPIRYILGYDNYVKHSLLYNIFVNFILGLDNGHLWYLASLFIIFIMYFAIDHFIKNKYVKIFLIFCLSIIGYLMPSYLGKALENIIWFGLGKNLYSNNLTFKNKKIHICLIIGFIILLAILYVWIYGRVAFYKYLCIALKYIFCFTVIPLLFFVFPIKTKNVVKEIDKNSFGIYLFHSPLVYFVFNSGLVKYPILVFVVNFFVMGFISYTLTKFVSNSKLKFIVGR